MISLTVVISAAIILFFNVRNKPANKPIAQTEKSSEAGFNVLLLGFDESGLRPDSILLVGVDPEQKTVNMLSIPRDTKVQINGKTHKINSSVALSGYDELFDQVKELTGAPIHYYISMKTGVFAKVVDVLGGLQYTVEQDMDYNDPAQKLYIHLEAGEQQLTGEQCEQYCRYRRYVMGDLTRTQKQQQLLSELIKQKLNVKYLASLPSVFSVISENTETNITTATMLRYLPLLKELSDGELQIQCMDLPGEYNDMEKEGVSYYLADKEEIKSLCKKCFLGA